MKTKHFYLILLAFVVTSINTQARTTPPPTFTAGIFLYYPNVTTGKGSATNGHPNEVEVLAVSYQILTGSPTPVLQDYTITKYTDGSSNLLQRNLVDATSENGAEIRIYKLVNNVVILISTTQFKGLVVTTYSTGGSGSEIGNGCNTCTGFTENISFSYTGIKVDNFNYNFN